MSQSYEHQQHVHHLLQELALLLEKTHHLTGQVSVSMHSNPLLAAVMLRDVRSLHQVMVATTDELALLLKPSEHSDAT
jgi:predicted ATPase